MVLIFRKSNTSKIVFFTVFDSLDESICSFRESDKGIFYRVNYGIRWEVSFHSFLCLGDWCIKENGWITLHCLYYMILFWDLFFQVIFSFLWKSFLLLILKEALVTWGRSDDLVVKRYVKVFRCFHDINLTDFKINATKKSHYFKKDYLIFF